VDRRLNRGVNAIIRYTVRRMDVTWLLLRCIGLHRRRRRRRSTCFSLIDWRLDQPAPVAQLNRSADGRVLGRPAAPRLAVAGTLWRDGTGPSAGCQWRC